MNVAHELHTAAFVVGSRIDYRCNAELKRAAREAETTRRSFGQLHRSDRWISKQFSTPPTKP